MGVTVNHRTFVIERDLPGSVGHAFRFWSDHQLKRRWTACHPDWQVMEDHFDFAIGGAERFPGVPSYLHHLMQNAGALDGEGNGR